MPITSVNPILVAAAAQGVERDLVLQPGAVIDAKVLQVLANNMVRIAIAGLSLDVMSQVPLQAGQTMQLAVSQNKGGIRLAVVGQVMFLASLAAGLAWGGLTAAGWAVSAAMAIYFGWYFWRWWNRCLFARYVH